MIGMLMSGSNSKYENHGAILQTMEHMNKIRNLISTKLLLIINQIITHTQNDHSTVTNFKKLRNVLKR